MRFSHFTSVSNKVGKHSFSANWKRYLGDMILVLLFLLALVCVRMAEAAPGVTVVTLTLSSASVAAGTPVTLTATVTSGGLPVHPGTVVFCDPNAPYCENSAIIGTAQLTSSGTAIIKVTPGIGSHSYQAVFARTSSYLGNHSSSQSLTVTGVFHSTTNISSTGSAGNYTLTGTVTGIGSLTLAPTGTVSFADTSNTNFSLGSATLGAATLVQGFTANGSLVTGALPVSVAAADLDGDGFADLVVANQSDKNVSVLLGNGDGTFKTAVIYAAGTSPRFVAVRDFDGDGLLDLAVSNSSNNKISILLGTGGGKFGVAKAYATGASPYGLVTGDFNGDGILDLASANSGDNGISVLFGNANGSFNAPTPYATGTSPFSLSVGDFNNDGKLDLAVTNFGSNNVTILLGNPDGTFPSSPSYTYTVGNGPFAVAVGDFNNDGKLDLAVTNSGNNSVTILLGMGDGSFQTLLPTYPTGSSPYSVAVGDFNGDGLADLVVTNFGGGTGTTISILLGNGDGTFQPRVDYSVGNGSRSVAVADFNGDGLADLGVTNRTDSTVSVLLNSTGQTASSSIASISIPGSGAHLVDALYPGNASINGSTSGTIPLTASPESTSLALSAIPTSSTAGQSVVLTATLSPSTLGNLITTGETVTFYSGSTLIGTGNLNSLGVATFSTTTLPVGTASLTAVYPGDSNFVTSTSPAFREVVNPTGTGVLNIQGRWEFAITSGDSPEQLSMSGQSTISSYILQSGTALTNIVGFNTDTIICDTDGLNNATVIGSSIDAGGNVSITFSITDAASPTFQYVFTGLVTTGTPMTIIGTYQKSAGGCTLGSLGTSGTPDGTFSATYFPDLSGTWTGDFDADTGTGPTSPATFVLTTNADKTLSGTVTSALTNAGGDACFAGPVTLTPGMAEGTSQSSGIGMELFGTDSVGTTLWVNAYSTNIDGSVAALGEDNPADGTNGTANDGTNTAYTAFYGISGGKCDGLGGGDAPFKQIVTKTPTPIHHGHHGHREHREHHEHSEHHGHHHRFHHQLKAETPRRG